MENKELKCISYCRIGNLNISNYNDDLEIFDSYNIKTVFYYDKNGYKYILKKLNYDKSKIQNYNIFKSECINYFINKYIKYLLALSTGNRKYTSRLETLNNLTNIMEQILNKEDKSNELYNFLEINKDCKIKYITRLLPLRNKLRIVHV